MTESRRRLLRWLLAATGVAAAPAWLVVSRDNRAQAARSRPGTREIPVVGVPARTGDLGVWLGGLGTVTPLSTVTVRTRVDGELVNVAFREGQLVREGDLLAEIDPRPFRVQLQQAEGQLAKDEAALRNARLDLDRYRSLVEQLFGRVAGDLDVLLSTLTRDVIHYFLDPKFPPISGAEHLAEYWRKYKTTLDPVWSIDRIVAQDDEVRERVELHLDVEEDAKTATDARIRVVASCETPESPKMRAYFIANDSENTELIGFPYGERRYLLI